VPLDRHLGEGGRQGGWVHRGPRTAKQDAFEKGGAKIVRTLRLPGHSISRKRYRDARTARPKRKASAHTGRWPMDRPRLEEERDTGNCEAPSYWIFIQ
jgi:hypothetical protein